MDGALATRVSGRQERRSGRAYFVAPPRAGLGRPTLLVAGRSARVVRGQAVFPAPSAAMRAQAVADAQDAALALLSPRQRLLYTYRVDLWEPHETPDATTYQCRYLGVRCYLSRGNSVSQPELFGRAEQDDMFTLDTFGFGEEQEINEGWILVNRTLLNDGSRVNEYGRCWVARGSDRYIPTQGRRRGGRVEMKASALPEAPSGVQA